MKKLEERFHYLMKKKQTFWFLILFLGILAFSTGIIAYLSDADKATNEISIGQQEIEIVEKYEPPKDPKPGTSFKKNVAIKNIGLSDCFTRVKVVFSRSDMEEISIIDWNKQTWKYNDKDGYWYYIKPLKYNETSDSLMENVTISEFAEEADIKDYDIIIYSESVQKGDFENYQDAWIEFEKNK